MPAIPCLSLLPLADRRDNRVLPLENAVDIPFQQVAISPGSHVLLEETRPHDSGLNNAVESR
jgi:hypothetical protein